MKLAIFHNLTSGGGKRALEEFCKGLHKRGHNLDLFIMDTADEKYLPLDKYINKKKVYSARGRGLFRLPDYNDRGLNSSLGWLLVFGRIKAVQRKIAEEINSSGYDLAFICGCIYTQAPFILRFLKVPSLYYCQEPLRILYESPNLQGLDNFKGRFYLTCAEVLLKNIDSNNISLADTVLTNSYYSRESILRAYGIEAKVNYFGVDLEKFKPLNLPKENMVLSVGGLQPRKGFRFIIQSLSKISQDIRPELVILADKYYYNEEVFLKRLAKELNVSLKIIIDPGDEAIVNYYNRAKAVIFAPYLEPFGFVTLEAMACGSLVIGVKEGGIREVIIDGENGILLDRDETVFANAIKESLLNLVKAAEIGANAREYVRNVWSWDRSIDKLEQYFRLAVK